MKSCATCGGPLPPPPVLPQGGGRPRKFCSERCRKAQYAGTCVDCGAPTNGYDGPGKAHERCLPCHRRFVAENVYWTRERIVAAIERWAGEHDGQPPGAEDWRVRGENYWPPSSTVQVVFGLWNAAIKAAGFDTRPVGHYGRAGEDPAVIAETVGLYRSGLTLTAIGRAMGCAPHTVAYRLDKAGEPRRPSTRRPRVA